MPATKPNSKFAGAGSKAEAVAEAEAGYQPQRLVHHNRDDSMIGKWDSMG